MLRSKRLGLDGAREDLGLGVFLTCHFFVILLLVVLLALVVLLVILLGILLGVLVIALLGLLLFNSSFFRLVVFLHRLLFHVTSFGVQCQAPPFHFSRELLRQRGDGLVSDT